MLGFAPLGTRPIAALPHAGLGNIVIESEATLEALLSNPIRDIIVDLPNNAQLVFAARVQLNEIGTSTTSTLNVSTEPFISRSTDTPANTQFEPTLDAALVVKREITGGSGFDGFVQNVSELAIIAADGRYDADADANSINGQTVDCYVGLKRAGVVDPFAEFEKVASLIGERFRLTRTTLTVDVRDVATKLDAPVQASVYLGTGGLDGDAEITGKKRPKAFGRLTATDGQGGNVTPVQVIAAEGLWQVNDGAVASITRVKDGGIELDFIADYATVTALRAAIAAEAVAPGCYGTCIADGYFSLGGSSIAQITCDLVGLNLTTADIIEEVALASAGFTAAQIDAHTFARLNELQPAEIAYYLGGDANESCREMFTKLMSAAGGGAGVSSLGKLQVFRFDPPTTIAAGYYETDGGNLVDIDRVDLPAAFDPPPRRWQVPYAINWTPLSTVYGDVSDDNPALADYLKKPHKIASTSQERADAILEDYPHAPEPEPIPGFWALEPDGVAEANRRDEIATGGYKAYRVSLENALFVHQIAHVINVRDKNSEPRFALGDGKYIRLYSIADDCRTRQTEVLGIG